MAYPPGLDENGIAGFVASTMPRDVDLIHDHTFNSAVSRERWSTPTVCTQHITRNYGVPNPVYVSKRALDIIGQGRGHYVYNGINPQEYEFSEEKHDYLLFMGRIILEKGILQAIEVAERTGQRLIIAGPADDTELFEGEIKHHMKRNPKIEYVGAVGGTRKQELLKHARCLLFPVQWEEPFGLVMIEAMACGTPVLGLANGSVPEVLAGFPQLICGSLDDMANKVLHEPFPSPRALREYVEHNFTTAIMTDRYLQIYELVSSKQGRGVTARRDRRRKIRVIGSRAKRIQRRIGTAKRSGAKMVQAAKRPIRTVARPKGRAI
jgi:glycosyltransferase involved in cell wall biosynthesis